MLRVTLLHWAKWRRSVNHSEVAKQRQDEFNLLSRCVIPIVLLI